MELLENGAACGGKTIHRFGYGKPTKIEIKAFNTLLEGYTCKNKGLLTLILNPRQNGHWQKIVKEAGFRCVSKAYNPIHGHYLRLYVRAKKAPKRKRNKGPGRTLWHQIREIN